MAMLKQPMIEKLLSMRLHGMVEALKTQEQDPAVRDLSFLERLGLLVDHPRRSPRGDVSEEYPDNLPNPKILLMAQVREEPLYVACAFDGRYAYIVTVHRYDPDRWIDPWTRK